MPHDSQCQFRFRSRVETPRNYYYERHPADPVRSGLRAVERLGRE